MCTLTLLRAEDALTLTMNRDDAPARPEAPPRIWEDGAVRFAGPVDLEAGGTWIGVNAAGVAACLLNRYDAAPKGARSRGAIVPLALAGQCLESAADAMEALPHGAYSPFACVIVSSGAACRFDWNGSAMVRQNLSLEEPMMMTSSSWRFEAVAAQRQALFRETMDTGGAQALSGFHCARRERDEAWAPMMRRAYAHTKSVTQIILGMTNIELRYWPRDHAIERGLSRPSHVIRVARCA